MQTRVILILNIVYNKTQVLTLNPFAISLALYLSTVPSGLNHNHLSSSPVDLRPRWDHLLHTSSTPTSLLTKHSISFLTSSTTTPIKPQSSSKPQSHCHSIYLSSLWPTHCLSFFTTTKSLTIINLTHCLSLSTLILYLVRGEWKDDH